MKRMMTYMGVGLLALWMGGCSKQSAPAFQFEEMPIVVSSQYAMDVMEELTKSEYGGRLSGTLENEKAADYIVAQFQALGLETLPTLDGYKQPFDMSVAIPQARPVLEVVGESGKVIRSYKLLEDFIPQLTLGGMLSGRCEGEIVPLERLADLGEETESYKDKVAVLSYGDLGGGLYSLRREVFDHPDYFEKLAGMMIGMPTRTGDQDHSYVFPVVPGSVNVSDPDNGPIQMACTPEVMTELLDYAKTPEREKVRMAIAYDYKAVSPSNVVGMIPGDSPTGKEEYIIISAHFDHVGDNKDGTYNPGALDNSSGTGAMLALAQAMATSPIPPAKTIIFVAFNGEEEGLFGSRYFVKNPPYSMTSDNTVVINLDMVGSANLDLLNIYSANIATPLSETLMHLGKQLGMNMAYDTGNSSDHYPFNQAGYQSITLINPDVESGYHTPADTLADVSETAMTQVLELVMAYLRQTAYSSGM